MNPINWSSPINWNGNLNLGLLGWWLNVPHWQGGDVFRSLTGLNDGVFSAAMDPTNWRGPEGRPGGMGSIDFAGDTSGDQVVLADSVITDQLTVAIWGLADSGVDNAEHLFSHFPGWFLSRDVTAGTMRFGVNTGSAVNTFFSIDPFGLGWQHYMATYDGTTVRIYLNGVQEASNAQSGNINLTGDTRIGGFHGTPTSVNFSWDGRADDARIWNRPLSPSEVMDVFVDSKTGYRRTLRRLRRRGIVAPVVDVSHVAALAESFDNVVQRRPIKVTSF